MNLDPNYLFAELKLPGSIADSFKSWNLHLLTTTLAERCREALTVLTPGYCRNLLADFPEVDGAADALEPLLEQVRSSEALQSWLLLEGALGVHDVALPNAPKLPTGTLEVLLGKEGNALFDLLVALSTVPQWYATYQRIGVPEHYARNALGVLVKEISFFHSANGYWGFGHNLHWYRHFIKGKLFSIGCFEYMVREAAPWVPAVFRNKHTGELVLLARDGWFFTHDGYRLALDRPFAEAEFVSSLVQNDKVIRGTKIAPRGFALLDKEVELPADDFEALMKPYELTAEIHIPGGGGMTMEKVQASLKEAREFFPRYMGWKVPFFWCVSWVFNPEIAAEMPQSNIAALQSRCYLAPRDSTADSGLIFVFGRSDGDWHDYPENTSLQRAFLNILRRGGTLKNGVMVIDDAGIDAFRPGFYQRSIPQEGCLA